MSTTDQFQLLYILIEIRLSVTSVPLTDANELLAGGGGGGGGGGGA